MEEELIDIQADALEVRVLPTAGFGIEKRAEPTTDDSSATRDYFVGCAVKFNVRSEDLGGFVEIIDEHAFDECDMSDVVCLVNHDNNIILGRTTAGTLKLEIRAGDGVYFSVPFDAEDPDHVRYKRKVEKGEISGCSFQFRLFDRSDAAVWDWEQRPYLRTVKAIKVNYDVGPVTFPAYKQTNANVAKRDLQSALKERRKADPPLPTDSVSTIPLSTYQRTIQLHKLR